MNSSRVIDYFMNPRNMGVVKDASGVGLIEVGDKAIVMELSVRVDDGDIADSRFKTKGCITSVACASYLTESIVGMLLSQARSLTPEYLLNGLGGIPEEKHYCAEAAVSALRRALDNLCL